jgi:hypothetical protein
MCVWWASAEFKAISERNQHNRLSKALVHHYGVDDHVHKNQRLVRYTLSVSFFINLFVMLNSML